MNNVRAIVSLISTLVSLTSIVRLRTMDEVLADALGRPRLLAQLLTAFAAVAVLLAAIGTFGVLSYVVSQRRREIGIRMALGAGQALVLRMVLSQGLKLAADRAARRVARNRAYIGTSAVL